MVNDQTLIDNTHFKEEDGKLICYTVLPDGLIFEQEVSNKEAVQKNMIGWCNTVREYISVLAQQKEEERLAKKERRKSGVDASVSGAEEKIPEPEGIQDSILQWYDNTQAEIDSLSEQIKQLKERRTTLRDERDKITPIIRAWNNE